MKDVMRPPIGRRSFLIRTGRVAGSLSMACLWEELTLKTVGATQNDEELFAVKDFTAPGSFTPGVEGPAVDRQGVLYAVNYKEQGTIGKITPTGDCSVFVVLPGDSVGNGIRFDSKGNMFIADYVNHNVLRVDMGTRRIETFAHEPGMNQPNDLAIGSDDRLYASDPNWQDSTGKLWRVDPSGKTTLLEEGMGTTNGIEVSPDNSLLYVNESVQRNVWAYDLSPGGDISNKRLLIRFADFGMDGMRCDTEGNLLITRYDKGTVVKVSPSGQVLREIRLKGKKPSNIAFGGADGKTCYVTLADRGNIEVFRSDTPGRGWSLLNAK